MKCKKCGCEGSSVIETKATGDEIRRRRKCDGCGERFTTYEAIYEKRTAEKKAKTVITEKISESEIASILKEELRDAIKTEVSERRKNGETFASIAKSFNCSRQNIHQFLGHKTEGAE